ncbi:NACHT domain-containing protein [Candidatus Accumulibacter sp. ACC003]|uniref:NACHT domain-containing protein n=1 Tax=Candidatus Accumulibacter sp. ACC003 TaxID=2823334 RepID=UPI0025C1778D|nr:NACHT domain-containing protein [Candidatus Accumulibacter sp. ACC003]
MDFSDKCRIISDINDEVRVLHPLLRDTFRHMDGVTEIEYTHGPNEKGADLIITRLDKALERSHQVGVIAKRGKIVSNLDDIYRQIEECQLPRRIQGGATETRLSEVWVVNTSTISNNAQDKINHKYAGQRVEFISGEKLTDLVDKHAPYFWHAISSDIGSYLADLARKISQLERDITILGGLGCDDFYITPEIQEFAKTHYVVKSRRPAKPRFVNIMEEVIQTKVSILEGEMGFGKSKTARHIAMHFCGPDRFKHSAVLPVFETFRTVLDRDQTLSALLGTSTAPFFNINEHQKCKYLFILDGLDEAIGKYPNWADHLNQLIQEAKSTDGYYLLLTSRPIRRIDEELTIYSGTQRYSLRPLSIHKLIAFIEKACEQLSVPKRLFEDLQKSDLFQQLPQSPIAAALLSRLIAQNSTDLPSNLTELYAKSVENLLGRWDISKGGCTEKEYRDAEQVAMDLANFMLGNRLIYISENEARERITSWHTERNTNTDLAALIERVFEKSGLFFVDSDSGTLSFRHRSFGEYLYALGCYKKHKLISPKQAFDPYWVSVQFFQTGLLGDCEEHLQSLMAYQPTSDVEAWLKILLMPEYFLSGYQTRYNIVEENLFRLFVDAAYLYEQAKRGKSLAQLSELPEMHLLWFFQRVIRRSFDYDYFKRSITTTLLRIDEELLTDEVKHAALFFAACFAAELNDRSGLEYLIKTYGAERLPLPISIAIKLEQNTNKDFAKLPLLKEHERKLNHMLKLPTEKTQVKALGKSQSINDLFEKPLKARFQSNTKEALT